MAQAAFSTDTYKLFPSPRNAHREVFLHEVFVPHPYALIDLPSFRFPAGGRQERAAGDFRAGRRGREVHRAVRSGLRLTRRP
jgi:hypothetical protein